MVADLFRHHARHAHIGFHGHAGDVRRQDRLGSPRRLRRALGQRLLANTSSAAPPSVPDAALGQGRLVDHAAARGIDQDGAAASCGRAARSIRLRVCGVSGTCSETTSLRASSASSASRSPCPRLHRPPTRRDHRRMRHAQPGGAGGDLTGDAAEADEAHGLAGEFATPSGGCAATAPPACRPRRARRRAGASAPP